MKIHKITMVLKRTQFQEIVISEETGFEMPKTANELIDFCGSIKNDPLREAKEEDWSFPLEDDELSIQSFDIEERNEPTAGAGHG